VPAILADRPGFFPPQSMPRTGPPQPPWTLVLPRAQVARRLHQAADSLGDHTGGKPVIARVGFCKAFPEIADCHDGGDQDGGQARPGGLRAPCRSDGTPGTGEPACGQGGDDRFGRRVPGFDPRLAAVMGEGTIDGQPDMRHGKGLFSPLVQVTLSQAVPVVRPWIGCSSAPRRSSSTLASPRLGDGAVKRDGSDTGIAREPAPALGPRQGVVADTLPSGNASPGIRLRRAPRQ